MKKLLLALGIFSSLAVGISLQGRGADNTNCNTFGECLSENLPNTGGGNGGGSGGGGGGIGLPPSYEWKPIFTDAQFQLFCDENRVRWLPKYDSNFVKNNGGILCFASYDSYNTPFPLTQKSTSFVIGGLDGVIDYYSAVKQRVPSIGTDYHLEDRGNLKFAFVNEQDKKLYIYDYTTGKTTPTNISGFTIYHTQVKLYCDENYNTSALGVIRIPIFNSERGLIQLAHKCNGEWKPLTIRLTGYSGNIYGNAGFIINKHIFVKYGYEIRAIPLGNIGKCIQSSSNQCYLNYQEDTKKVLDLFALDTFIDSKTGVGRSFRDGFAFPDINDGKFVLNTTPFYPGIINYDGNYRSGYWFFYAYFEVDSLFNITGGYISSLAHDFYKLQEEQNNYCIYKVTDKRGFEHTIEFHKGLTANQCPQKIRIEYNVIRVLASNNGILWVGVSLNLDNRVTENFLGILYPDTSQVDGYYQTKIPFYPASILKLFIQGERDFRLVRVDGKDYVWYGSENFLIHSPQFNRSDADAERY